MPENFSSILLCYPYYHQRREKRQEQQGNPSLHQPQAAAQEGGAELQHLTEHLTLHFSLSESFLSPTTASLR